MEISATSSNDFRRNQLWLHFNGLGMHLGNLSRLSDAVDTLDQRRERRWRQGKRRHGERRHRQSTPRATWGMGWKVSPSVRIKAGETFTVADIEGPGAIQQIWLTPTGNWRFAILRIYWDGQRTPVGRVPGR